MRLPVRVNDPALVLYKCQLSKRSALGKTYSVRSSLVRSPRDNGGGLRSLFVGYIVDCQSILVVPVADITAVVLLVGSTVDDALCVVHVAVLGRATRGVGLSRIIHVDEDKPACTRGVAELGTDSNRVTLFLVHNNVMGTSNG